MRFLRIAARIATHPAEPESAPVEQTYVVQVRIHRNDTLHVRATDEIQARSAALEQVREVIGDFETVDIVSVSAPGNQP